MGFFGRDKQKQDAAAVTSGGGPEFNRLYDNYRRALAAQEEFDARCKHLQERKAALNKEGASIEEKLRRARAAKETILRGHATGANTAAELTVARRALEDVEKEARENAELLDAVERASVGGDQERTSFRDHATHAREAFYQHVFSGLSAEIRALLGDRFARAFAVALLCQHPPRDFGGFVEQLFDCRTVQQRAGALEAAMSARAAIEKEYLGD